MEIFFFLFLSIKGASIISLNFYELLRNLRIKNKKHYRMDEINREINARYSPAVLSYLMDHKLEAKKDVAATILNLYAKKVIDIKKEEYNYVFTPGTNNTEYLGEDEKYIYNSYIDGKKRFEYSKWRDSVVREYKKYSFENEKLKNFKIFIDVLIILLGLYIGFESGLMVSFIYIFLFLVIFNAIYYTFLNIIGIDPFLSETGTEEVAKWLKFKKFIKEYTLIEERKVEEIRIYERFIPYAMALKINKEYTNEELNLFNEEELKELKVFLNL